MMPRNHILWKCTGRYKLSKSQKKINHLMYMDDIKLFAKNERELETLIQAVRIYSKDIGMEFGVEKCSTLIMKSEKRHMRDWVELPNQEKIRTLCDAKCLLLSQSGVLFRTCEDRAGWHLIPYRISPRSEFFSQAYKTWHITWGINLGPDRPPLARGSKFHTIHTPTRPLSFLPLDNGRYEPIGFSRNNIIL